MKKRLLIVLAAAMLAVMMLAGCASNYATEDTVVEEYYAETQYDTAAGAEEPETEAESKEEVARDYDGEAYNDEIATDDSGEASSSSLGMEGSESSILEPSVERKIIYNGYVNAQTKQFEEDYQMILDTVKEVGGYIENAYVQGTEPEDWQDTGRYAELTLRIPSSQFDAFIELLGDVGETVYSSVSGTDISLEYFDTETRLETLRTQQERLLELLEQAAGLEDIIEIESELADVEYEIQSYEVELRNYDSLVDYSTITLMLQEVQDIVQVTSSDESIGSRIKNGFFSVLNALADFGEWLIVFIISALPVLVILGIIAVVVVLIAKAARKKRIAKQNKDNNER